MGQLGLAARCIYRAKEVGMETLKERIIKLEDNRFETMMEQIRQIHAAIFGNGSDGIITKVAKNTMAIKAILWAVGIIYTAAASYIVVEVIKRFC